MKTALLIAFVALFQQAYFMPLEEDSCRVAFSEQFCQGFEAIDDEVINDHERMRRQLPPPPPGPDPPTGGVDTDLLERLLKEKLNFLINFGLLKHIPFLGQAIHDFVAQDPDGVARALKGGIGGLIQIGMQLLGRIG